MYTVHMQLYVMDKELIQGSIQVFPAGKGHGICTRMCTCLVELNPGIHVQGNPGQLSFFFYRKSLSASVVLLCLYTVSEDILRPDNSVMYA